MITTILFDMGGTLEDIWYDDSTVAEVTHRLLTFLKKHQICGDYEESVFWEKLSRGIRRYKDWSEANELELKPGGTILVYTDGAPEATNASDELFGTDRMLESLNRHLSDTPRELVEHLKEDIDAFVGDAPQFDDLTALCVQWNGSGQKTS